MDYQEVVKKCKEKFEDFMYKNMNDIKLWGTAVDYKSNYYIFLSRCDTIHYVYEIDYDEWRWGNDLYIRSGLLSENMELKTPSEMMPLFISPIDIKGVEIMYDDDKYKFIMIDWGGIDQELRDLS